MKIAMILDQQWHKNFFTDKAIQKLRDMGELVIMGGAPTHDKVKALIKDADFAITSWGNEEVGFPADILDECPNLKMIMHAGGSVKGIVSDEVWKRGIKVACCTQSLGIGVAETALGFAISASKNFYQLSDEIHAGGYSAHDIKELYNIKVGVISAGFVGRHFIKLMHNFGVEILLYDPTVDEARAAELGVTKMEFADLLRESDIVSIHAPSLPATYHLFNADTLKLMKKDAVLINTARGGVVDENALAQTLREKRIYAACVDTVSVEPMRADCPLYGLDNCYITPHIAWAAKETRQRLVNIAAENVKAFLEGKPQNKVN
jgi:phosphoglycerate dehydrogenase-like enzyme